MLRKHGQPKTHISRRRDPFDLVYPLVITAICLLFLLNWGLASAQQSDNVVSERELAEIATAFESAEEDQVNDEVDRQRALLRPQREATISSLIAAQIRSIHVRDGESFKSGDLLVSFRCDTDVARLEAARARLRQHQSVYAANVELRRDNAVSKLDLELSEARVEEGKADVALASAQLDKCSIFAPYDGRVVKVVANEHETTRIGSPLVAILDDQQFEVTLHAPSEQVTTLSVGQRFNISIDETNTSYPAVITAVLPAIDPASRTVEITAEIEGTHPELVAGMSGDATFEETE